MRLSTLALALMPILNACQSSNQENATTAGDRLFVEVPSGQTNIDFANNLELDERFDVFRYRNYYNGGGVAIGDINGDGLEDIFLTANQLSNKLYLNKGNFQFEDITEKTGVAGIKAWSTGVAMADVNGDGLLDIYVCNSGDLDGDDKENELYINNGDLTFTERAKEYGLGDDGFSTHAVFFDYDKDGDLDCYILNNSFRPVSSLGYANLRNERDRRGGDKLYLNDDGKFVDVSEAAGIYGSVIGFGLGVTVGDVNLDGWQDIYISNDFYERDYLYINQKDGTFREALTEQMGHTSHFSMGADMADLNNDRYPEVFVTDMLPEKLDRLKQTTNFTDFDTYQLMLRNDFHHQFMRNTLQINNGDDTFSEISQALGVDATDWSWGALLADFDNNGYRDIFVCNGVYKDVTDQDFINFLASDENFRAARSGKTIDFKTYVERMPSNKISNYLFANQGNFRFENQTAAWGLDQPSHSNGAAYGDLDNDGDLDLIVNNVNDRLFAYQNQTERLKNNNYLKFKIKGTQKNTFGIGTKILVYLGDETLYHEHMPMRGFQSSMGYEPVIGIGAANAVDSVLVISPYGAVIRYDHQIAINRLHEIDFTNANADSKNLNVAPKPPGETIFGTAANLFADGSPLHFENTFVDFDRDRLLYHMLSNEGPRLAVGDINGDGADDFYLCGAHQQAGQLYIFDRVAGRYKLQAMPVFTADRAHEDVDAIFFDADGDGDLDLYVTSGGSEFLLQNELLQDRLYLNENGALVRKEEALPRLKRVSSCVQALDYDGDGDLDLFVGGRLDAKGYGVPTSSFLFENDGQGNYKDVTALRAPRLRDIGMVTAAQVADLDGNGRPDLIIAGDWMPITILYNQNGSFPTDAAREIPDSEGLWRSLALADVNADGRPDVIAGNLGLNARFRGSVDTPMRLIVKDFDNNGSYEQIFAKYEDGDYYPYALKHNLGKILPMINKKFTTFNEYKDKSVTAIFGADALEGAYVLEAKNLATTLYLNEGENNWQTVALPLQAQFAPMYGVLAHDFDRDGRIDLLFGGNFYAAKPEVGRYDASYGALLLNQGDGRFEFTPSAHSGLRLRGQVRDFQMVTLPNGRQVLLVAKNNDRLETHTMTGLSGIDF